MSQIFDALQRFEADRSGVDPAKLTPAAELLEIAESQVVRFPGEDKRPTNNDPRVQGAQHLEKASIEQLGQFQSVEVTPPSQSDLVCVRESEGLAAEKFRFLSVRLRHLQQRRTLKRVLITSSMAEEGKSMIAANLACTLARKPQQKVLLLEGDLRRPSLMQRFGLGGLPGLSESLQGEAGLTINIYHLKTLGFWILPAGYPRRNPLEVMQSGKLPVLMDQLVTWFDWIVIDSPPMLPLADTSIWVRMADAVLLVTRPGRTAKRQLQRALEEIDPSKLLGALLNGSEAATLGDYYHYYGKRPGPQESSHTLNP